MTVVWVHLRELMPKGIAKADLPAKPCERCGRPFAWRKKWAKVWNEVKFCSERCKKANHRP